MTERAVLLICDYDPTSPLIGALRVDRFATYLTEMGWSTKVLSRAGVTHYDLGRRTAPSGAQTGHYERPLRTPWLRLARKLLALAYRRLVAFPDRGVFGVPRILFHARDLDGWRPTVIVVSGPPFSTFMAGSRLSREWGVPWIADYRDLWTNSTYYVCGPIRRRLDGLVEKRILQTVAFVTTVSEPLAVDMRRDFAVRAEVVMNGFEPDEVPPEGRKQPTPGLPLRLVYTGEIYEGRRDPGPLFEALRRLGLGPESVSVEFRGITVLPVQEQADRAGVGHLVHVGPALPRNECLGLQQSADVLLLLMWNHPGEVGIYSGKLFEYLGTGRPILMLGYEQGAAAELIRGRGAGCVANTPDAIAEVLARWIELKRTTGSVPASGDDVVAGLTRRDQAAVLGTLLAGLITTGT